MYLNFQWLMSRLPAQSKVIVWGATNHMAKDLGGVPGQERLVSLGSYVHREFKDQAFTLGFSASSGSFALVGQPVRQLSVAPGDSLEGRAFSNPGAETNVLDGLLVFREERPPVASTGG